MAGLNICPYCGSPEVHVSEWLDSDSGEPSTMLHATSAVMKQRQNSLPMKKQLIIGTGVRRLMFIMPTRVKRAYTAILFRKSKEHQSYIFKVNSKSACLEHWLYA